MKPTGTASQSVSAAKSALDALAQNRSALELIDRLAALLAERFAAGRKVMICGNGGSACDAMHFAEELTGRFRKNRPALPALACTDLGHITCTANDYGFEHIFSRWVEALGHKGDVLIVLSTSGNSDNVLRAAEAGRARGLTTVSLSGGDGGKLKGRCDYELIMPATGSDRIQELHMMILHTLVEGVEHIMFGG